MDKTSIKASFLDKTNIKASFKIVGKDFDVDDVTQILDVTPTRKFTKGDKAEDTELIYKFSLWKISTDYMESLDTEESLEEILEILKPKVEQLHKIKEKYTVNFEFSIVIRVEENMTPGIHVGKKAIAFANEIQAEFDIDLYLYS